MKLVIVDDRVSTVGELLIERNEWYCENCKGYKKITKINPKILKMFEKKDLDSILSISAEMEVEMTLECGDSEILSGEISIKKEK